MPGSPSPAATLSSQLLCYSIERWRNTGQATQTHPTSHGMVRLEPAQNPDEDAGKCNSADLNA